MSANVKKSFLQIHPDDNVLVALQDLPKGLVVEWNNQTITLQDDVHAKHKFFITERAVDQDVLMYGVLVGKATAFIPKGGLMTTDNVHHAAQDYAYRDVNYQWQAPDVSAFQNRTFNGYHRDNGEVGTANYWLFIPTVFCENRNLDVIKEALYNSLGYNVTDKYKQFAKDLLNAYQDGQAIDSFQVDSLSALNPVDNRVFKNVDGIKFLNHQGGCGGTRQDSAVLSNLLAAYADHPNVGGITILSLGCQHLQANDFLNDIKTRNPSFNKKVLIFEQQQSQSEDQMIKDAILKTFVGLTEINEMERSPAPLSKLCVGVKCGGSDGFSGISANPAVGYTSDLLVALGAKVLLAEFPELCGAEQNIVDRCVNKPIAEKFISLMRTYDAQAHAVGSGFHMNPSPGNIKDGLITDAIKSTGAAKKAGTSPVVDVLDYTEPATKPGLSLVCTPGNDVEATTGKAASGATLILFTTGLGTPTGNPVCPVIKVATNTSLATRMNDIIDIDTGAIIRGEKTIEEMGTEILEYCIKAASGEITPKAVLLNQDDFIPWKRGVSL
ncbi:UxaA family hydrolase [Pedobacter frigoris]|uniref:Altronate dehydratase n=1 Tax=Pedobacter frigoris TaxID=2571272 RepID=A0A4U1CF84_9SPHI|nr:altronate dehydratase family protein [Pedobacter frigoris]TKC05231.1 altronate dehydratase [Pedobacter frigoris]